jgi:hypothetical protein
MVAKSAVGDGTGDRIMEAMKARSLASKVVGGTVSDGSGGQGHAGGDPVTLR